MSSNDYDALQAALGGPETGGAAAEAHGTLCGLLCAGVDDLPEAWIHNTLADAEEYSFGGHDDARAQLEALHDSTLTSLQSGELGFALALPDDEAELGQRAAALAAWCNGFLYGLAVRGLQPMEELPDELREILSDFAEIGRAGVAEEEAEESGESAFVEIVEYVRVAVQILWDECRAPGRDQGAPPPRDLH